MCVYHRKEKGRYQANDCLGRIESDFPDTDHSPITDKRHVCERKAQYFYWEFFLFWYGNLEYLGDEEFKSSRHKRNISIHPEELRIHCDHS